MRFFRRPRPTPQPTNDLTIHPDILAAFNRPRFPTNDDDSRIAARIDECDACARSLPAPRTLPTPSHR